jgi:hypothetical protein
MFQVDRTAFGLPYSLRHWAFDVPRGPRRACPPVYNCSKNAAVFKIFQCPDSAFRQLAVFLMSFWNKKIGFEDGGFGDQKALLEDFIKFPMTESRCVHYTLR